MCLLNIFYLCIRQIVNIASYTLPPFEALRFPLLYDAFDSDLVFLFPFEVNKSYFSLIQHFPAVL